MRLALAGATRSHFTTFQSKSFSAAAAVFGFFIFASLGLPGLGGFVGEFLVFAGTFAVSPVAAAVATLVMVFAGVYLLWMYQRVAMGNPKPEFEDAHIHDVHVPEWIAWVPILLSIVVFGLFPNLLFSVTNDAAVQVTRAFSG